MKYGHQLKIIRERLLPINKKRLLLVTWIFAISLIFVVVIFLRGIIPCGCKP